MEVVGLVAAVPGLIDLVKITVGLLRDVAQSRKALSKATKGLDTQIKALSEVLQALNARGNSPLLSRNQHPMPLALMEQLHGQVESLNDFLAATICANRLRRIWIVIQNPKKKLAEYMQELERSISILNLHLHEYNIISNDSECSHGLVTLGLSYI